VKAGSSIKYNKLTGRRAAEETMDERSASGSGVIRSNGSERKDPGS